MTWFCPIVHLFWGVTLYTLYRILFATVASLMRLTPPLLPSQTYALIFVGEVVSFAPFTYTAYRQYTMVQNGQKHRIDSHLIIHCPTSEGVSEASE